MKKNSGFINTALTIIFFVFGLEKCYCVDYPDNENDNNILLPSLNVNTNKPKNFFDIFEIPALKKNLLNYWRIKHIMAL